MTRANKNLEFDPDFSNSGRWMVEKKYSGSTGHIFTQKSDDLSFVNYGYPWFIQALIEYIFAKS